MMQFLMNSRFIAASVASLFLLSSDALAGGASRGGTSGAGLSYDGSLSSAERARLRNEIYQHQAEAAYWNAYVEEIENGIALATVIDKALGIAAEVSVQVVAVGQAPKGTGSAVYNSAKLVGFTAMGDEEGQFDASLGLGLSVASSFQGVPGIENGLAREAGKLAGNISGVIDLVDLAGAADELHD